MADIFSGLATGLQAGQQLNLQKQQAQQAQDDKQFNRLVATYGLIPKGDVASKQRILDQLSDLSDGQIPKLNLEQGETVMGILKPSLQEFAKGVIDKNEVLDRINVLGLERPSEAAGLEKFATGFEERATTEELQQAQQISQLPQEQFEAGGGEQAIQTLLGQSEEGREQLAEQTKPRKVISGITLGEDTATIQETTPGSGVFEVLDVGGILAKGKKKAAININLGKPGSAGERTAIAETRATIDELNNLKTLFEDSFVGPVAGRVGAIKNIFGLNPVRREGLIAATSAFKNAMIKAITGAQMSEPEAKRIMKQVPSETDAPSVWLAKWEQSVRNLETMNKRRIEVLKQSRLLAPEGEDMSEDLTVLSDDDLLQRIGQ